MIRRFDLPPLSPATVAAERLDMIRDAAERFLAGAGTNPHGTHAERVFRRQEIATVEILTTLAAEPGDPCAILRRAADALPFLSDGRAADAVHIRQAFRDPTPSQIRRACLAIAGQPVFVAGLDPYRRHRDHRPDGVRKQVA